MIDPGLGLALSGAAVLATAARLGALALRALRLAQAEVRAARVRHDELCEGFSELAGANAALRRQLERLAERVERADPVATPAAAGRAYELAARLASGGAAAHDLVAHCGLTPAEADLAVLVHGTRAEARAVH